MDKIPTDMGTLVQKTRDNVGYIALAIVIVTTVLLSFVQIRLADGGIDWLSFACNVMLSVAAFSPARMQAKHNEGRTVSAVTNRETYGKAIAELREKGQLSDFEKFCAIRTEEAREQKRADILFRAGMTREEFEAAKGMDKAAFAALPRVKRRAVRKASGTIKVRPISPSTILADFESRNPALNVAYNGRVDDATATASKVFSMLCTTVVVSLIGVGAVSGNPWQIVIAVVTRVFLAVTSFFSGMFSGTKSAQIRDSVVRNRIMFLSVFGEWYAKQPKPKEPKQSAQTAPLVPTVLTQGEVVAVPDVATSADPPPGTAQLSVTVSPGTQITAQSAQSA